MQRATLVPAMVSIVVGCAEPVTSSTQSPIIGGTVVAANEFSTVVALEQGPGNWFCTGTLIAEQWVLTAAHCVFGAPPGAVKIRIDDLDVNDAGGGTQIGVTQIHRHPGFVGFNGGEWGEDVALLELATALQRPMTPIHRTPIAFDTAVTQVGYGVTDDQGNGGGILRKLSERNVDCALTGDPGISNDKVLCFDPADGGGCNGDSGGPTFVDVGGGQLEVVGVTSGGTEDACTDSFGIWSLVPAELSWIDSVMTPPEPDPDPEPEPEPEPPPAEEDGGCSSTGGHGGFLLLVALAFLRRRRG